MTLADVLAASVILALNAYVLLAGADFGGGVWGLLAGGPRRAQQRDLVAHAIGPVWEANHVWLILAVVLLFTCFPATFATLGIALHIPLSLALIGIVLRGAAFTFWRYGGGAKGGEFEWGEVFAAASLITPLVLGTVVGAIAAGRIGDASTAAAGFYGRYVGPWLTPFAVSVGVFAVVAFAFLAAVYLTLETDDRELREDFRKRALGSGVALFVVAVAVLLLARTGAPRLVAGLVLAPWALPLHLLTAAMAVAALGALWWRHYRIARVAAAIQVSVIFWGWPLSQYPYTLPPDLTIADAAAPAATLRLTLAVLTLGAVILLPSLYYLFRVFKGRPAS